MTSRPDLAAWPPERAVSWPARPDRPNEDLAQRRGPVSVLVDGAGTPAFTRPGCAHEVSWFARSLGGAVLAALEADPQAPLREACAGALAAVAALHGECVTAQGPSATLIVTRLTPGGPGGGTSLEYLVLCDSSLVVARADGSVEVVTDDTLAGLVEARRASTPEGEWIDLESLRNAEGGFWVARVEPEALDHALTGTVALGPGDAVLLASDGALRPVEVTGTMTAQEWAARCLADPQSLLALVRDDERAHAAALARVAAKPHDDATVLLAAP